MARPYLDLAAELKRRIESGTYAPKSPMPSERSLVGEFRIHRATVRRALGHLATEGLVSRSPGQRAVVEGATRVQQALIGLFAAAPDDPFARSIIANGISDYLGDKRAGVRLVWSNYHRFELEPVPHSEVDIDVPTEQLAALVLWPPKYIALDRLAEARKRMPVVLLDRRASGFESDFVGFQDVEAGYAAARHLYEVGHRRLAFIGEMSYETSRNRRLGFERFCYEAGVVPMWPWAVLEGGVEYPSDLEKAWMSLPKEEWPTAAVCTNDETAARMMSRLARFGMRAPEDLGLMGFGGAQSPLLSALGLTTMEQPYHLVGKEAARLALTRVDGHHHLYKEVRLPMTLRVRTSCGA